MYRMVPEDANIVKLFSLRKDQQDWVSSVDINLYLRNRKNGLVYLLYYIYILITLMFYVCVAKSKIVNLIELLYDIYQNQEQKLLYTLNFYLKDICVLDIYFVNKLNFLDSVFFIYFLVKSWDANASETADPSVLNESSDVSQRRPGRHWQPSSLWVNAYRLFLPYWKTGRLSSKRYSFIAPFKCSRKGAKISSNIPSIWYSKNC